MIPIFGVFAISNKLNALNNEIKIDLASILQISNTKYAK
jgi:hypothetical protein